MVRWFVILCWSVSSLSAMAPNEIVGNWYAYREASNNGTVTIEKEYLHLKENNTFALQIFVTVKKGDAFIKDLRIEGSGIWKRRESTLVIYIQKVEVPFAKEIYLISQESLRNLANNFKHKYESEPLRIVLIESFTGKQLVTSSEKLVKTSYTRQ